MQAPENFKFGFIPGSSLTLFVSHINNAINWVDFAGIANAFLIGLAGGLGGWLIKFALDYTRKNLK